MCVIVDLGIKIRFDADMQGEVLHLLALEN